MALTTSLLLSQGPADACWLGRGGGVRSERAWCHVANRSGAQVTCESPAAIAAQDPANGLGPFAAELLGQVVTRSCVLGP